VAARSTRAQAIGPERVESKGYAFQVETVFRALRAGFGVEEVPILFADRAEGGSKMGPGIVVEAMVRVPALRLAAARGRL
jgi:dolichol-phosphate mannosyltransferase